jgi:hypothetical protein
MGVTKISDLQIPELYTSYMQESATVLNEFIQSGIVDISATDELAKRIAQAGSTGERISVPFLKALSGDSQLLKEGEAITVNKISSNIMYAPIHRRAMSFGASDLSSALSGADPIGAVYTGFAKYWVGEEQKILISTLNGIFANNIIDNNGDLVYDISETTTVTDANRISGSAIIRTAGLLGDASKKIVAIAMHSDQFMLLQEKNLIDTMRDSDNDIMFPTYLGKRVIVDDSCPKVQIGVSTNYTYTTYLFANNSIVRANWFDDKSLEAGRDIKLSEDYIVTRHTGIYLPKGFSYVGDFVDGSGAYESPSLAKLEEEANWSRVYEKKNVGIVALITN